MKPRCVIISAGQVDPCLKHLLKSNDYIIACDAGYLRAQTLQIMPDLVLGDFDSAPVPQNMQTEILPAEKDDTDTHYAARIAVQKGFAQVLMLGSLGGKRFEHSLANLATGLWLAKQGIKVQLASPESCISYVLPGQPVFLKHDPSVYFSLFPMNGEAQGVTVTGAKYPLQQARISPFFPVGISNETLPGIIEISLENGCLLLVETKKEG